MPGLPKAGTLERLVLERLIENGKAGVTYMDFIGTGVTEENIDQIVQNLRNGMYESEDDDFLRFDS
jgi:hypothetical protein